MIHLRLVVPREAAEPVVTFLRYDVRVTNVVVLPGAAQDPVGDAVFCDVARESASEILDRLRTLGVNGHGAVALSEITASPSAGARRAEAAASGSPDDAIVWEAVVERASADSRQSWSFHAFLCLATAIAAIAVITDSSVLVVGAMVVGPEFGPVAAIAVGLALRQRQLVGQAVTLLCIGFLGAITATAALAWLGDLAGWVSAADVLRERPLTGFIWKPDRWSFVVALLAGAAGVLSLTAGRASALIGVFISVTTVPAAGNLALALALGVPSEITGALTQLGVNLGGLVLAGTLVLLLQRQLQRGHRTLRRRHLHHKRTSLRQRL